MLTVRESFSHEVLRVQDVVCSHRAGRGEPAASSDGCAIVLVRRGSFVRTADGVRTTLDPTLAYASRAGQEERFDHPHSDGDTCTALTWRPDVLATFWGGDPELPSAGLRVAADVDLEHRLLLSDLRRRGDVQAVVDRAIDLTARLLQETDPRRTSSGRPSSARARIALTDDVRHLLAEDPGQSLPHLAAALAVSPHHLSRVFAQEAGHSISRHRMQLRARTAIERLDGGETSLARLAAEVGFADQGHMCRVVRDETGHTPSSLRRLLG